MEPPWGWVPPWARMPRMFPPSYMPPPGHVPTPMRLVRLPPTPTSSWHHPCPTPPPPPPPTLSLSGGIHHQWEPTRQPVAEQLNVTPWPVKFEPLENTLSYLHDADETVVSGLSSFSISDQATDTTSSEVLNTEEEQYLQLPNQEASSELLSFNSIDEALDSIEPQSAASDGDNSIPMIPDVESSLGLVGDKKDEVIKAAKSLFSKRTRTLYHWLFPEKSKTKLKATVTEAWDTLPQPEKHFYISQVLGRFGLQASSLMVNPQLGGIKGLPPPQAAVSETTGADGESRSEVSDAVSALFDACAGADSWASYPARRRSKRALPTPPPPKGPRRKYRKRKQEGGAQAKLFTLENGNHIDDDDEIMGKQESPLEFEEDPELSKELEKFELSVGTEEIWDANPDPDDLFSELKF